MEVGIEFQLIWHDNDVLNLRVSAWNGDFGGVAEIYEGVGDYTLLLPIFVGFPAIPATDAKSSSGISTESAPPVV
jgi:hypothetical protein